MDDEASTERAFAFDGNWREFAPIAFTNLLLTLVTLGIYVFWARARVRRYLWSHTRFIDDRIEYVGTGLELFIGYLLALVLIVIPLATINFAFEALMFRHQEAAAAGLVFGVYLLVFYLIGVAVFRALRYRLSRSYWHGIRGGSDAQGLGYGVSHVWRNSVGAVALGLMVPWAMTSLWNQRWNRMSFGPHRFSASARYQPLLLRYLLYYLVPFLLFVALVAVSIWYRPLGAPTEESWATELVIRTAFYVFAFIVIGLVALAYYAAFFREAVSRLSLGDLDFEFDASTWEWIRLMIVNLALTIFTLGIGGLFVGYRNWAFFIRHLNAYGEMNLDELTQSATRAPGQGEGLLDAFDVGTF